ncbi:MAG: hypothetical protein AABY68_14045 [Pseudomonadota bacterium]
MFFRASKLMLLWLLCLTAEAEPLLPLSRFAQPPVFSPSLWLALDTQADPVTADTQPLSRLIDDLAREVTSPWPAQRALPSGGVALGLLAVTQAGAAAEVLHPSRPLDVLANWPSQTVSRQLSLIRNTVAQASDAQRWPLGQQQSLILRWPMPDAPVGIAELSLDLPLRIPPAHWPVLRLQFADGFEQDLPPPQVRSESSGPSARLLLHSAITAWQRAGHAGQIPPWPWRILLEAQTVDQQGAWASWQVSSPAKVNITWRDEGGQRTGREQWLRQLHGLLAGEGVQLPANDAALQQLTQQILASHSACAQQPVLSVTPAQPDMISALERWRDRQLGAAPVVSHQKARMVGSDLLGLDRDWHQPVAGRRAWPGGTEFHPCRTSSACELAPAPTLKSLPVPLASWFTDTASGQPLQPLSERWPAFAQGHPDWQSHAAAPPTEFLRGFSRSLDAGPSAATATGRQGYLLWVSSDGSVQLQDSNDGHWLWAWRPSQSASLWANLMQDAALDINTADHQYAVSENDWAYWPDSPNAQAATGLDSNGQRWLYGLVDRQLVALDLTQPEHPRSGFLPIGSSAHPAQAKVWGSLSLLPLTLSSGLHQPLLLLSAADPASSIKLLILDGRSGDVLWQAGSSADSQYEKPELTRGWLAAWRTMAAADGALLAYGVDELGGVWRLRIAAKPTQPSAIQVSLSRIADFSATGTLYPYPPSVAWLRDNQGRRYPALALAGAATMSSGAARPASVMAFLDSNTALITASDLPLWNSGAQPPTHAAGWRRTLAATELIAQPPRWLDQQLILAGEVPASANGECPAWAWQARLYRWPWRAGSASSGSTSAATETSLPATANAVGDPLISAEGELRWSGISAADSQATKVVVPVGYRQRVRQRQLRADD